MDEPIITEQWKPTSDEIVDKINEIVERLTIIEENIQNIENLIS